MLTGLSLMVLAIYKSASYWKNSSGFKGFKLVEVLIRDQAVYFLMYVSPLFVFDVDLTLKKCNLVLLDEHTSFFLPGLNAHILYIFAIWQFGIIIYTG